MRKKLRKFPRKHEKIKDKKKNLWSWIKENPILILTIVSVIISAVILFFMLSTHESAPEVNCEIEFIQRPDSLYQAQLYIWNEGDKIAENIIIWAKKEEVFLWNTSGNYKKGRLNIFPHFTVYAKITPNQYLDEAARVKSFPDHQIILPQLSSSLKEDNYIIIGPNVGKNMEELEKLKSLPNSIYRLKYIELGKTANIKSYREEILDNVQVIHDGKKITIKLGNVIPLEDIDSTKYYFPTFKEFDEYQQSANLPNHLMPPIELENKVIKKKKDKNKNGWFPFF